MRYLVTGAGGFAGGYLVRLLAKRGHAVTGLTRRPGQLKGLPAKEVVADALDAAAVRRVVRRVKPDGIFHLAAPVTSVSQSWQDPAGAIQQNEASTLSVLEAARSLPKPPRTLFIASSEMYGTVPVSRQPLSEKLPLHPENPYAVSKALGEQASRFYAEKLGVPVIISRSFNHIGPGQAPKFVLPSFAEQIAAAERPGQGIIKVGNLKAKRDFTDVRDVVEAYTVLMRKGIPGQAYNVGSGTAYSISELLRLLIKLSPATIKVVVDPTRLRPNDVPLIQADNRKLKRLGWRPKISIDRTLTDVLEEVREGNRG